MLLKRMAAKRCAARRAEASAANPSRRERRKAAANPAQLPLSAAPVPSNLLSQLLQESRVLSERADRDEAKQPDLELPFCGRGHVA